MYLNKYPLSILQNRQTLTDWLVGCLMAVGGSDREERKSEWVNEWMGDSYLNIDNRQSEIQPHEYSLSHYRLAGDGDGAAAATSSSAQQCPPYGCTMRCDDHWMNSSSIAVLSLLMQDTGV